MPARIMCECSVPGVYIFLCQIMFATTAGCEGECGELFLGCKVDPHSNSIVSASRIRHGRIHRGLPDPPLNALEKENRHVMCKGNSPSLLLQSESDNLLHAFRPRAFLKLRIERLFPPAQRPALFPSGQLLTLGVATLVLDHVCSLGSDASLATARQLL